MRMSREQRHYENENSEELEEEEDCKHKKRSSCGTPLFSFKVLYQPILGAVKATEVVSAAARSSGKL